MLAPLSRGAHTLNCHGAVHVFTLDVTYSPRGPIVATGSTLTFTYVVTNTGNVSLANVFVTDKKLGTIAGPGSATRTPTACSA
jgi:hypothetical protein